MTEGIKITRAAPLANPAPSGETLRTTTPADHGIDVLETTKVPHSNSEPPPQPAGQSASIQSRAARHPQLVQTHRRKLDDLGVPRSVLDRMRVAITPEVLDDLEAALQRIPSDSHERVWIDAWQERVRLARIELDEHELGELSFTDWVLAKGLARSFIDDALEPAALAPNDPLRDLLHHFPERVPSIREHLEMVALALEPRSSRHGETAADEQLRLAHFVARQILESYDAGDHTMAARRIRELEKSLSELMALQTFAISRARLKLVEENIQTLVATAAALPQIGQGHSPAIEMAEAQFSAYAEQVAPFLSALSLDRTMWDPILNLFKDRDRHDPVEAGAGALALLAGQWQVLRDIRCGQLLPHHLGLSGWNQLTPSHIYRAGAQRAAEIEDLGRACQGMLHDPTWLRLSLTVETPEGRVPLDPASFSPLFRNDPEWFHSLPWAKVVKRNAIQVAGREASMRPSAQRAAQIRAAYALFTGEHDHAPFGARALIGLSESIGVPLHEDQIVSPEDVDAGKLDVLRARGELDDTVVTADGTVLARRVISVSEFAERALGRLGNGAIDVPEDLRTTTRVLLLAMLGPLDQPGQVLSERIANEDGDRRVREFSEAIAEELAVAVPLTVMSLGVGGIAEGFLLSQRAARWAIVSGRFAAESATFIGVDALLRPPSTGAALGFDAATDILMYGVATRLGHLTRLLKNVGRGGAATSAAAILGATSMTASGIGEIRERVLDEADVEFTDRLVQSMVMLAVMGGVARGASRLGAGFRERGLTEAEAARLRVEVEAVRERADPVLRRLDGELHALEAAQRRLEGLEGRIRLRLGVEQNARLGSAEHRNMQSAERQQLETARAELAEAMSRVARSLDAAQPLLREIESARSLYDSFSERYLDEPASRVSAEALGRSFDDLPEGAQRVVAAADGLSPESLTPNDIQTLEAMGSRRTNGLSDLRFVDLSVGVQRLILSTPRLADCLQDAGIANLDAARLDVLLRVGPVNRHLAGLGATPRDLPANGPVGAVRDVAPSSPLTSEQTAVVRAIEDGHMSTLTQEQWLSLPGTVRSEFRPGGNRHRHLDSATRDELAFLRIRAELGDESIQWVSVRRLGRESRSTLDVVQVSQDQFAIRRRDGSIELVNREQLSLEVRDKAIDSAIRGTPSAELGLLLRDSTVRPQTRLDALALEVLASGDPSKLGSIRIEKLSPDIQRLLAPEGDLFSRTIKNDPGVAAVILALNQRVDPAPFLAAAARALGPSKPRTTYLVADVLAQHPGFHVGGYQGIDGDVFRLAAALDQLSRTAKHAIPSAARALMQDLQLHIPRSRSSIPREIGEARVDHLKAKHNLVGPHVNVAIAHATITRADGTTTERRDWSHSNQDGPHPSDLQLGNHGFRVRDAERTLLERLMAELPADTRAITLRLYSERPCCGSCQLVLARFVRELRERGIQLQLHVSSGAGRTRWD